MPEPRKRKTLVVILGACFLVLFLALATLNAFNLKELNPSTASAIFLFTALTGIAFLLFVLVVVLLLRNIVKLFADRRSRVFGSRLRTRMLVWVGMISVLPVIFMFLFSYFLLNRSIDRWFSQPVTQLRDDANNLATQLSHYTTANARSEADALALLLNQKHQNFATESPTALEDEIRNRQITLQGGFAAIYRDGKQVAAFQLPIYNGRPMEVQAWLHARTVDDADDDTATARVAPHPDPHTLQDSPDAAILHAAQRGDDSIFAFGNADYALATAWVQQGGVVVVGLPMPTGMSATVDRLRTGTENYWKIFRARRQIRTTYMLVLFMITGLTFFASTWLALQFSTQITSPVEAIADAMGEIAAGHYDQRVDASVTEELGELVNSFNHMAQDLETSRNLVEQSNIQISAVNAALNERRREVETMLETIPNGVVMLDRDGNIVLANRAFSEMMDPGGQQPFIALPLQMVFPPDVSEGINRLMRRSHRMGHANGEFEFHAQKGILSIVASVALLENVTGGRSGNGYVVVLEDVTELLRAQKQMAWKEVARRVAHEIKNPLTPVALSSERIHKHIDRLDTQLAEAKLESPSIEIIRKCSEVITGSVETMRQLVDQFSALAQFPSSRPRPADLNAIVENSLAIFAGRLQNVTLKVELAPDLPLVMADPEALKRALTNLIDNAAEAMQTCHLRELTVRTALLKDSRSTATHDLGHMLELSVADTGTGLTNEIRERLFLPYFSTKERGTGLGLSIASKIVQEHEGTIRAERNIPAGAVFIIELPIANLVEELPEELTAKKYDRENV